VIVRLRELKARLGPALADRLRLGVPLAPLTALQVGGPAEAYLQVSTEAELVQAVSVAQTIETLWYLLAGGSNLCISDRGIRGLVVHNRAADLDLGEVTRVATGHGLMQLFLKSAAVSLSGLQFAVGIPGAVGGALISNAGAYRQSIGPLVEALRIVRNGQVSRVPASWMEFAYRDSRLRRSRDEGVCVTSVALRLTPGRRDAILAEAREYQQNRIHRQPWSPSAGSFFKNVYDRSLAERVRGLPEDLRAVGVVPAGYLSAECGCKGLRRGGAEVSQMHANFIVNRGGATATDVRLVAEEIKRRARERFGVELDEEVIYAGDW